ncbi:MAG: Holliday junction resolvase RuvX [Bryobacteraceae bacterium]
MATLTRNSLYNPKLESLNRDAEIPLLDRQRGRVLALDVGKKRIGLAVSDELGITAQGLETLHRTRIRADLEKLKEIARHWKVRCLVIGQPLHMSGSESRQSDYTREFAERLGQFLELPVVFLDERLTSVHAERLMREAGASLEKRRNAVDRIAAMLLLETYLGQCSASARPDQGDTLG